MTNKQLQKLCAVWQERLSLQDWKIRISFAHTYDFSSAGVVGECRTCQPLKRARILILHPNESPDQPPDIEATLVHELLHVHTVPFRCECSPDKAELHGIQEEQAIESLVPALIGGWRGKR